MNVLKNGEILLHGTVGEGLFEEGFTAVDVISALAEVGRTADITVRLNSGGGIAMEGVAIFNALDSHRGKISMVIESVAASAASLIAMAGDEITMRIGSILMIHDPSGITFGNKAAHEKTVEGLETISSGMADIYAERTGRPVDEIRAEMAEEIWLTPVQAVDKGYADRADERRTEEPSAAFDYRLYQHAPDRLIAMAKACNWTLSPDVSPAPSPAPTLPTAPKTLADLDVTEIYARLNKTKTPRATAVQAASEPAPPGNFLPAAATAKIWDKFNRLGC